MEVNSCNYVYMYICIKEENKLIQEQLNNLEVYIQSL
jgi:hypothetical protein